MKVSGSWISQDHLKKILRMIDRMAEMSTEEKTALKDRLSAADDVPEENVHVSEAPLRPETVLTVAFFIFFLFLLGVLMEKTAGMLQTPQQRTERKNVVNRSERKNMADVKH